VMPSGVSEESLGRFKPSPMPNSPARRLDAGA
jgi:hypothetical protein